MKFARMAIFHGATSPLIIHTVTPCAPNAFLRSQTLMFIDFLV